MSGSACECHCSTVPERQGSLNPTQKINDFGATTEKCERNDLLVLRMALSGGRGLHYLFRKGKPWTW